MLGMRDMPGVVPERNGTTNDADHLARLAAGRWDGTEAFLRLRCEAIDLGKSHRYRRLAVAVYERLTEVEVLDQDDLRQIYEEEQRHVAQAIPTGG